MNARISPRKPLKTRVVFQDEHHNDFLYFVSDNISTSGLFVTTDLKFAPGSKVFLKFTLFEGSPPIQVTAEVMRLHEQRRGPGRKRPITPGLGLKFLGLRPEDYARIHDFVGD